jgi:hypothetical protein
VNSVTTSSNGENDTTQSSSTSAGNWQGVEFSRQWLTTNTGGAVLHFRCDTCAVLIKPHVLDLIAHAEWHLSL